MGNAKTRTFAFWHQQDWPFMERFRAAGFDPDDVDNVVHTHLHADHVGRDTHRDTPGHVSLWVTSQVQVALPSGDFLHHPVQCSEPTLAEVGDEDPERARTTRRRLLGQVADDHALFLGTHFPTHPAGHVVADPDAAGGDAWRFHPVLPG